MRKRTHCDRPGCTKPLTGGKSRWCSSECSTVGYIEREAEAGRWFAVVLLLNRREAGECQSCGLDTNLLDDLRSSEELRALGFDPYTRLWEADHKVPRILGGADSIENARTLCQICHRDATARLAKHRARRRRLKQDMFEETWVP